MNLSKSKFSLSAAHQVARLQKNDDENELRQNKRSIRNKISELLEGKSIVLNHFPLLNLFFDVTLVNYAKFQATRVSLHTQKSANVSPHMGGSILPKYKAI